MKFWQKFAIAIGVVLVVAAVVSVFVDPAIIKNIFNYLWNFVITTMGGTDRKSVV